MTDWRHIKCGWTLGLTAQRINFRAADRIWKLMIRIILLQLILSKRNLCWVARFPPIWIEEAVMWMAIPRTLPFWSISGLHILCSALGAFLRKSLHSTLYFGSHSDSFWSRSTLMLVPLSFGSLLVDQIIDETKNSQSSPETGPSPTNSFGNNWWRKEP